MNNCDLEERHRGDHTGHLERREQLNREKMKNDEQGDARESPANSVFPKADPGDDPPCGEGRQQDGQRSPERTDRLGVGRVRPPFGKLASREKLEFP